MASRPHGRFTTSNHITGATIWADTATPAVTDATNVLARKSWGRRSVILERVHHRSTVLQGSGNTGAHVGHLWTRSGVLLATATFSNETASGWQESCFSQPVAINANTTYVISYYAPNGKLRLQLRVFHDGCHQLPLRALANGEDGWERFVHQRDRWWVPDPELQLEQLLGGCGLQYERVRHRRTDCCLSESSPPARQQSQ